MACKKIYVLNIFFNRDIVLGCNIPAVEVFPLEAGHLQREGHHCGHHGSEHQEQHAEEQHRRVVVHLGRLVPWGAGGGGGSRAEGAGEGRAEVVEGGGGVSHQYPSTGRL